MGSLARRVCWIVIIAGWPAVRIIWAVAHPRWGMAASDAGVIVVPLCGAALLLMPRPGRHSIRALRPASTGDARAAGPSPVDEALREVAAMRRGLLAAFEHANIRPPEGVERRRRHLSLVRTASRERQASLCGALAAAEHLPGQRDERQLHRLTEVGVLPDPLERGALELRRLAVH